MKNQTVLILDFGGQYKELIARRVRECAVYSEIMPADTNIRRIVEKQPIGIIFSGGPNSVYALDAPQIDPQIFELGVPILGICYGVQLISTQCGGSVTPCDVSEYGQRDIRIDVDNALFHGLESKQVVLMSHSDQIERLPDGFRCIGSSISCPNVAIADGSRKIYGVQFHPEVELTHSGMTMLHNFLYCVCGAIGDYTMDDYLQKQITAVQQQVGTDQVILALSGGVDSAVCAALLAQAIPGQLSCIFVDHGLMRKDEGDEVEAAFSDRDLTFIRINAESRFLDRLSGVSDPETKRKIIGSEFVRVFDDETKKFGEAKFLAQGTIYPDVIESGTNSAAVIKSHHNVGGLPKDLGFKALVEPLRGLFKDEVRQLGRQLGLPDALVNRQPFPGPGLAVRVIGEITREKLDILREADCIYRTELEAAQFQANQYFAVLTNLRSVGVMGDGRTYDYTLALRAVVTTDFMTAAYAHIPHELLAKISRRITNEVKGINRVVYDITDKPPSTIEWE